MNKLTTLQNKTLADGEQLVDVLTEFFRDMQELNNILEQGTKQK